MNVLCLDKEVRLIENMIWDDHPAIPSPTPAIACLQVCHWPGKEGGCQKLEQQQRI